MSTEMEKNKKKKKKTLVNTYTLPRDIFKGILSHSLQDYI